MRLLFCPQSYEFFLTLHLVISTDSTEVHCRCLEMIFGSEGTKTNFELFLEQMFFPGCNGMPQINYGDKELSFRSAIIFLVSL